MFLGLEPIVHLDDMRVVELECAVHEGDVLLEVRDAGLCDDLDGHFLGRIFGEPGALGYFAIRSTTWCFLIVM